MTRPTRIGSGGREVFLGPGPGGAINQPPSPDCCESDPEVMPDRGLNEFGAYTNSLTGAFPTVLDMVASDGTGTSYTVDLPPPNVGDLVLVFVQHWAGVGGFGTLTWPDASWVQVEVNGISGLGGEVRARLVTGLESWFSDPTPQITVTNSTPSTFVCQARRIFGHDWNGTTGVAADSVTSGGTSAPDAPNLAPAWGAADTLWFVVYGFGDANNTVTVYPIGFTDDEEDESGNGIADVVLASAQRELTAASLDPGTATTNANVGGEFFTVAVKPSGGSAAWVVPQPATGDGDDDTCTDPITGPDLLQRDLIGEYRIARTRLLLETAGTGTRTLTITAWSEFDESDSVTLTTHDFTATGASQEVEWTWPPGESYRFYRLSSSSAEDVIFCSWEMYEPTLAQLIDVDHPSLTGRDDPDQHPADSVSVDTTGFDNSDATDLQELAEDFDAAITAASAGGTDGNVYTVETQAPQSRRYLMGDGTFRDPFTVGDGVIAVGSITTITDDSKYNAWPSIARMRGDRVLLGYTKGDTHHGDNTGKAVGKIGAEGLNGSITWGTEFTIYDDPSEWVSLVGLSVLSSGRIIASLFRNSFGSNPLDGAYLVYSDDEGATWSSLVTVNSSLTDYSYGSGRALELPNGDLLQCVEGENSGDTFSRMVVLRSTDQGETWGNQVTIATGTRNYYEACLGLLDDDSILVLLRTSDASGDIYQSSSTDGGATWATPSLAFAGHGQPNWIQNSTGTIFAITRENDGSLQGGVWAYTSTDRGATWSTEEMLDDTMYEMEYGCPIELLDGRTLVVYGYQPTSATTNSDIKQVYITEGLSPFAGGSSLVVEDEGTPLATDATTLDFVGAGVTASGTGATKTITIPGGAASTDLYIWRPVMDGAGAVVTDGATGEAIMAFGPA